MDDQVSEFPFKGRIEGVLGVEVEYHLFASLARRLQLVDGLQVFSCLIADHLPI